MSKKFSVRFQFLSAAVLLFLLSVTCLASTADAQYFSAETIKNIHQNLEDNIATKSGEFSYAIYPDGQKDKEAYLGSAVAAPFDANNPGDDTLKLSYTYCWARDNGVTMVEITSQFSDAVKAKNQEATNHYGTLILDYIGFLKYTITQKDYSPGITKFYLSGQPVTAWMNPQNDGPAFNALFLSEFANIINSSQNAIKVNETTLDKDYVEKNLINKDGSGLINFYLSYIVDTAMEDTIDIWESCSGKLFFPEIIQLKALVAGAALSAREGNISLASKYLNTSLDLCKLLKSHYQTFTYNGKKYKAYCEMANLPANLNFPVLPSTTDENFSKYRGMSLDMSVILGSLYGNLNDYAKDTSWVYADLSKNKMLSDKFAKIIKTAKKEFSPTSKKIKKTVELIAKKAFTENGMDYYQINKGLDDGVCLIGRYPGDIFTGLTWNVASNKANPWYLCSTALAEYYYTLAYELDDKDYLDKGNQQMELVFKYLGNKGTKDGQKSYTMSEQIDRNTGTQASFHNLTWSYSQYLRAYRACNKAMGM